MHQRHTLRTAGALAARSLLAAFLCLALPAAVRARRPTEVRVEAVPTAMKCGDGHVVLVRAEMPADGSVTTTARANAIGFALVTPGETGSIKFFGRYWFRLERGDGAAELIQKRDDDSGTLKGKLSSFESKELPERLTKFLTDCGLDAAGIAVFAKVLDESTTNLSLTDLERDFVSNKVPLTPETAKSAVRDLGAVQNLDDATQMRFAQMVHTTIGEIFGGPGPDVDVNDNAEVQAANKTRDEAVAARVIAERERDAARSARDEALAASRLSHYLEYLFRALALALALLLLAGIVLAIVLKRWGRDGLRLLPARARGTQMETPPMLPQQPEGGGGPLADSDNGAVQVEVEAVKDMVVYCLGREYASKPLREGVDALKQKLKESLDRMVRPDSNVLRRLEIAGKTVEQLWSRVEHGPCPEAALEKLDEQLSKYEKSLEPLRRVCPEQSPQDFALYMQEATGVFEDLTQRFKLKPTAPGDVRIKAGTFFTGLFNTHAEFFPGASDPATTPDEMLTGLSCKLGDGRNALTGLETLDSSLEGLRRELKPEDGQKDPVELAQNIVRDYQAALGTLRPHAQGHNGNLAAVSKAVADQISSAKRVIEPSVEDASGSLDSLVTDLFRRYEDNKDVAERARAIESRSDSLQQELTQTQTQTRAFSAVATRLSQLVYLSGGEELTDEDVAAIGQRIANAEFVHRQLRLRLSAAVDALDLVTGELRDEGRADALEALRVEKFRPELLSLLDGVEDFRGKELWNRRLFQGFSTQGLSLLLRAELLATTYFDEDALLSRLIDPLHQAGGALRAALGTCGVTLTPVKLLSEPPPGVQVDARVDSALRALKVVRDKVMRAITDKRETFIVDVEAFPYDAGGGNRSEGLVIKVVRAEWV